MTVQGSRADVEAGSAVPESLSQRPIPAFAGGAPIKPLNPCALRIWLPGKL